MSPRAKQKGFTLVEILVAMVISGFVMTAIYATYQSQQRSYILQDEIAKMQQNLRAAMFMMTSELRMAGFDPSGMANAGIVSGPATPGIINLSIDVDGNGVIATTGGGENITYNLYTAAGIQKLGRRNPTNNQPVAENIDYLAFRYLDANNLVTATLANIRSVEITMIGRTGRVESGYSNQIIYRDKLGNAIPGFSPPPPNDGYHRSMLITQVKCRNLGL